MTKVSNNVSFTSQIRVTKFPKFQELNDIRYGMREFITPCLPDKTTKVQTLDRMVNKQTRTCTSINLIFRPNESSELQIKPVHIHHTASIRSLGYFLKNLLKSTPNIESIIMWGYKDVGGEKSKQSKKVFDKALEILSKEKEVTYFKGHNIAMDLETNALYTNQGDIMYLAPKSWTYPQASAGNLSDFNGYYKDHHIAKNDELVFEE